MDLLGNSSTRFWKGFGMSPEYQVATGLGVHKTFIQATILWLGRHQDPAEISKDS